MKKMIAWIRMWFHILNDNWGEELLSRQLQTNCPCGTSLWLFEDWCEAHNTTAWESHRKQSSVQRKMRLFYRAVFLGICFGIASLTLWVLLIIANPEDVSATNQDTLGTLGLVVLVALATTLVSCSILLTSLLPLGEAVELARTNRIVFQEFLRDNDDLNNLLGISHERYKREQFRSEAQWSMGRAAASILLNEKSRDEAVSDEAEIEARQALADATKEFERRRTLLLAFNLIKARRTPHFNFAREHIQWQVKPSEPTTATVP